MAGSSSVGGLASGLDTATIINQLMQLEAAPQTRLKTRVSSEQSVVTTLQSLNTQLAGLRTKAEALAKASAWTPLSATSSNAAVTVTTGDGAEPTSLAVTVTSVARTHLLGFATTAAPTDVVTGASTQVTLDRYDGSPVTLETGDGTLQGLVDAVNDPGSGTGLRATLVNAGSGGCRLMVESVATGAAQDFTLTRADGSALLGGATVRAGTDAALSLGAGISVGSTTNTFTDLVPGVTLTLGADAASGTSASIGVTRDTAKVTAAVQDLVTSLNSALSAIDKQTAYNATTKTSGPLAGDAGVRSLRDQLLEAVYPADGSTLSTYGIQVNRNGLLDFDAATFTSAYVADPAGTAERFDTTGSGFAARVAAVTKSASDSSTGTLTASITGRTSGIEQLKDTIDEWDRRLELRRTTLEQQFTALETALSQLNSQSSWLSSQIANLSAG